MLSRLKQMNVFFKDSNKKNSLKIIWEAIHYGILKKTLPVDYFRKFLYRKDIKNYKDYLSLKEYYSIIESKKMVFPEVSALLLNKLIFKWVCEKQGLPVAPLLGYSLHSQLIVGNQVSWTGSKETLLQKFNKLLDGTTTNQLFLKPIMGIGGQGCMIISKSNLMESVIRHQKALLEQSYLIEEYIQQHPNINEIHPFAINTLRMVHYIDSNNTVHILSVLMRFGIGTSITDNTSTGGFSIAVNSKTGVLEGPGRQDLAKGGAVYSKHPDTQVALEGFVIPYFQEACNLVKKSAKYFPNRIVGWDIAITPSGPVIIEANHNPSLHLSDVAYGGYKKHPLIKEILKEINI